MISLDIDERGLGTLAIADAEGELHAYRVRLIPRGLALWAVEMVRCDTEASYRVALYAPSRWTCTCPAETYRKRGSDHCKHCQAAQALRSWHNTFTESSDERVSTAV